MTRWLPLLAVFLGSTLAWSGPGVRSDRKAVDPEAVEVLPAEQLSLASMLIGDGHWDRAKLALAEVDTQHPELDAARYHTLMALVAMHERAHSEAVIHLRAAIDAGADEPRLHAHLAHSLASQEPPDLVGAWEVLEAATARYPGEALYDEQRVLVLVELGLYQEARALGARIQQERGLSVQTQVVVAEAMHRAGQTEQALIVLEQAMLLHPEEVDLVVHAARLYLSQDMPLTAGSLLQRAVEDNPALALEAAECFRQAGNSERALMLNARVPDATDAARQRLGLLLELEEWERASALHSRLSRLGLLSEDEVRYGLAYARFKSGDLDAAESLLKGIADPVVFARANALRSAMDRCRDAGGCL
ncbi:MAG: hypothetical protein VX899_00560 [Myxococcota bacterium]|nr:hypothetical protein [Myxococcota bacterium]